jgi:two-component system KDP operon response regulator KdpE
LLTGNYGSKRVSDLQGKRILVIDDDPHVLRLVELSFPKAEAQVYTAASGAEGLRLFYAHRPHLVILGIMTSDLDGWEVYRQIHQISDVPVIFLTALGKEGDIIRGLNHGVVDYVTKPFSPQLLVARAQAVLRQAAPASGPEKTATYSDDYLTIDLETRQVLVRGEPVGLSTTEYQMLAYLLQNAGRVLTFRQILESVWGWEYRDSVNYVHVYVWHLRQKLEEDPKNPQYLLTEHGVGYRFQKPSPS